MRPRLVVAQKRRQEDSSRESSVKSVGPALGSVLVVGFLLARPWTLLPSDDFGSQSLFSRPSRTFPTTFLFLQALSRAADIQCFRHRKKKISVGMEISNTQSSFLPLIDSRLQDSQNFSAEASVHFPGLIRGCNRLPV
jgi:hypothetical protein